MTENVMGKYTRIFRMVVPDKPVQLVAEDPNRVCLFVQNIDTMDVYILSAQNQDISDGICVAAGGGTYKNDTTTAALWIVTPGETQSVRVEVDGN